MINDKQYLKNLLIVKKNLTIFLKMYDKGSTPYIYYHTKDYLDIINNEINFINNKIKQTDKEFYSSLLTIYDFGVWYYDRLSDCNKYSCDYIFGFVSSCSYIYGFSKISTNFYFICIW